MKHYKYTLEPYNGLRSRHTCPGCNKKNTFTRYIDTETGEYLADDVGRCNRENNCAYHYTPKQYFTDNGTEPPTFNPESPECTTIVNSSTPNIITLNETSFIEIDVVNNSLMGYTNNNFVLFCVDKFGVETTDQLIDRYFIGTSSHWQGATVFWQVDINYRVRTGKIMLYNALTCKRIREPFNHITWSHKAINHADFNLKQCLFGEHLLNEFPLAPVAIVESEKTAIIASAYLPKFIWLAAGSINNLNIDKCCFLKNRKVVLYPDIKAFEKWKIRANELSYVAHVQVSDLLENHATDSERIQGLDLADFLLKFKPSEMANTSVQYNIAS